MKKRLTVNTLAFSNIRRRKKQYAAMLTGIIFAMVFLSAILFFASSINSSMDEMSRNSVGDCEFIMINCDESFIKQACGDGAIADYGYGHIIGFADTESSEEGQGAAIGRLDENAKKLSYITFEEGGYPQNDGEIAIEKSALAKLYLTDAQIGDTVTLNVYNQNGSETESKAVQKSYKLVGIVNNKLSNITDGYMDNSDYYKAVPTAFVYQGADTDVGGKENLCCYFNIDDSFRYNNNNYSYQSFMDYLSDKFGDSEEAYNSLIEIYQDNYTFLNTDTYTSIVLAILLAAVLLAASGMGVINAFNTNLNERKKQIGLFRTVGATKRQIILIYGREAFVISIACAPASVLISYFLVRGIAGLFGDDFIFVADIKTLLLSAVFGIMFVMAAAMIPLVSASRISPMQSIRNISLTRKMKNRKIKSQKSFNPSTLFAKRRLTFHSAKRAIVSVLLIITIIFSCYGFSYLEYSENTAYTEDYDYQLMCSSYNVYSTLANYKDGKIGYSENQRRDILVSPYVDTVGGSKSCTVVVKTDEFTDYQRTMLYGDGWSSVFSVNMWNDDGTAKNVTTENIDELFGSEYTDEYLKIKQEASVDGEFFPAALSSSDSSVLSALESYVIDGEIDITKINSGEEVILVAPQKVAYAVTPSEDGQSYSEEFDFDDNIKSTREYLRTAECDYKAGDTIDLSVIYGDEADEETGIANNYEANDYTVKIGAILREIPSDLSSEFSYGMYNSIMILTSNSAMNTFDPDEKYQQFNIALKCECTEEIETQMQSLLQSVADSSPSGSSYIYSRFGSENDAAKTQKIFLIAVLSIVILFLSISASVINNSLAAQIREGKREMGALRAVGASKRDFVMSYIKQLAAIFIWGCIIGFAGFGISYGVIYFVTYMNAKSLDYEFSPPALTITLWQTILACVILFAVCSVSLLIKIHREMKNSIIENIREL